MHHRVFGKPNPLDTFEQLFLSELIKTRTKPYPPTLEKYSLDVTIHVHSVQIHVGIVLLGVRHQRYQRLLVGRQEVLPAVTNLLGQEPHRGQVEVLGETQVAQKEGVDLLDLVRLPYGVVE